MINTDLDRLFQSDEIQNVIKPRVFQKRPIRKKKSIEKFLCNG